MSRLGDLWIFKIRKYNNLPKTQRSITVEEHTHTHTCTEASALGLAY